VGAPAPGRRDVPQLATAAILAILWYPALGGWRSERGAGAARNHRTIRGDQPLLAADQGIGGTDVKLGSEGYPPDLETLVKGVNRVGALDRKLKFLRRIPVDPMTSTAEWGLRCYQDDPDSTSWCGENVWDVYSKSTAKGLDGTNYNTW
jgi:hypothetical protein